MVSPIFRRARQTRITYPKSESRPEGGFESDRSGGWWSQAKSLGRLGYLVSIYIQTGGRV